MTVSRQQAGATLNIRGRNRWISAAFAVGLLIACGQPNEQELIAAARISSAKGDRGAAIIGLKTVLQAHPESGEARFLLGRDFRRGQRRVGPDDRCHAARGGFPVRQDHGGDARV